MGKLDQVKIPVKCGVCGKSQQIPTSTILNLRKVKCFSCGSEGQFGLKEALDLKKAIKDVETAEKKLGLATSELSKANAEYEKGKDILLAKVVYLDKRK